MPTPTKYPYNMSPPWGGSGGIECDGFEVNDGTENSLRQPVSIGDPITWGNAAAVAGAAPAGTEMGVITRDIIAAPNSAGAVAQVTVGASSVALTSGSPAPNRRTVKLKNTSDAAVFIGFSSGVTTSTGYQLAPGESDNVDVGPALTLYAIAAAAGNVVHVLEIG